MALQTRTTLKTYFEIGKRPTHEQFADLIDSMLNKTDDGISITSANDISMGITNAFQIHQNAPANSLVLHDGGNVGIGLNNPQYPVHISGDGGASEPYATLYVDSTSNHGGIVINATSGKQSHIRFSENGNLQWQFRIPHHENGNNDLKVYNWGAGADIIVFQNNTGNVGIGTDTPQSPLHIESSTNRTISLNFTGVGDENSYTWQSLQTNSTEQWRIVGRDDDEANLEFWNKNDDKILTLLQNGNMGIGLNNPQYPVHISGDGGASEPYATLYVDSTSNHGGIVINTTSGKQSHIRFSENGNLRWQFRIANQYNGNLRIYNWSIGADVMTFQDNTGNVGIGTTNPSHRLHVNGIISGTNVNPSDQRLKKNIKTIREQAIDKLRLLRGVTFQHKTKVVREQQLDERQNFGFLAQEVKDVFPELVYGDREGMLSLSYTSLIPILVEAYKALDEKYQHLQESYQACMALVNRNT